MNKIESFFVSKVGVSFSKVFVLLITLFFLWGFALGLLDILNKHFQDVIQTDASKYALVLLSYYAGYLLMPLPASLFTERFGYKNGIILGLLLFAVGAFMFFPTSQFKSFPLFLFSLFFIALGMAALETVVNPYTTLVGKNKYSTFRITLGQSFTSLGWFFGPFVGGTIILDQVQNSNEFAQMAVPYVGVGILVLFIAILFLISELPKISEEKYEKLKSSTLKIGLESRSIFKRKHFSGAVIAMFFYIAAQTALFGFYTKYLFDLFKAMESQTVIGHDYLLNIVKIVGQTNVLNDKVYHTVVSSIFVFAGFGLFTIGRFVGSFILIKLKPNILLFFASLFSLLFSVVLGLNLGLISFVALCLITLSMSTMFPIIFSLGIRKMGYKTKRASALIIMAIVGGSTYPILIHIIPNANPVNMGIIFLIVSFIVTFLYGYKGYKIDPKTRANLKTN